ncbi:hypothetical protein Ahy_A03g015085 isoform C [Arachis hypogaea]|uniref:Myb/SANT-like DNA-binding domain-containing protein n=1 Tax=Arachis hypogaea TaxID=3818 RepID=A0A445DZG2_ARAHY|nr:hypothetical protein Ahy_A03g015085 isoform C [Arachis hypogaea]
MDSVAGAPSPTTSATAAPPRPPPTSSSPFPGREDCWNEEATFTLIDAWGDRYLELNRGNLRQKHWQEVADAVNELHAGDGGAVLGGTSTTTTKRTRRTDVQCKNRIDTLKKKYKIEKARVSESGGSYQSPWPFFSRLDNLIGDTFPVKKLSPPASGRGTPPSAAKLSLLPPPAWIVSHPVGPRSGTQKRTAAVPTTAPANREDSYFRRNFSAFAAAAAAAAEAKSGDSDGWRSSSDGGDGGGRRRKTGEIEMKCWEVGYRELAQAIEKFGEIYERVEASKQRQMVELEKQRMQFAKDLEYQRMQLFMETQVQFQKIKRAKRTSGNFVWPYFFFFQLML